MLIGSNQGMERSPAQHWGGWGQPARIFENLEREPVPDLSALISHWFGWIDREGHVCRVCRRLLKELRVPLLTCALLTVSVKYERIKFLVIALKSSVEVYAWAPKPYHKFMAFKVIMSSVLENSISHAHCDQEPGNKSADHSFKTVLLEGGQQVWNQNWNICVCLWYHGLPW